MIRRTAILLGLLALAPAGALRAQFGTQLQEDVRRENTRRGTRGANFLEIGIGARAGALAGAVTADVRGVSALYWNTAGIAHAARGRIGATITQLYEGFDMTLGQVGGILPVGNGAAGVSLTFFSSGEIERTTIDYPQGNDPLFGKTFTYTGTAVSLHYARLITDRLAVGGAVRYAQEGFEGAAASYVGIDVGTQFQTGIYGTTIGAAITNVGSEGRFEGTALRNRLVPGQGIPTGANVVDVERTTQPFAMPTTFRFSVMADLVGGADALIAPNPQHQVRLLTDISDGISTPIQGSIAAEYSYREILYLRGGKRFYNEGSRAPWSDSHGLAGGVGLVLPLGRSRLTLDYAYQPWGLLNNVQILSVEFAY